MASSINLTANSMCDEILEKKLQRVLNPEKLGDSEPFRLMDEVMRDCDRQLQGSLKVLKENRRVLDDAKANYDQRQNQVKVQARDMETQIREQFKRLHQFLQDEEEARIVALMEEEEQKRQKIKERSECLSTEIASLSDAIRDAEDHLQSYNHISFLENYKATMDRVQLPLRVAKPITGVLMDEAKELGNLDFTVWDKTVDCLLYSCAPGSQHSLQLQLRLHINVTETRRETASYMPTQRAVAGGTMTGKLSNEPIYEPMRPHTKPTVTCNPGENSQIGKIKIANGPLNGLKI